MKSNYIGSKSEYKQEMRRIAKEEIERQKKEFCTGCQATMETQTIAVLLMALHNSYGFGKKRLSNVLECAKGLGLFIHQNGDKYDDAVAKCKELGIELDES